MKIKKIINYFTSPKLFFYACAWLIVLLVLGTVAQKYIGLYQAQSLYFSSWVIWINDFIPVPGGYVPMGLIMLGLTCKLLLRSPLTFKTSGTYITHLGALMLLVGGVLTALFGHEGSMSITEGDTVNYYTDYHKIELAIVDRSSPTKDKTYAFQDGWLEEGKILKHDQLPFKIEVKKYCKNCNIQRRVETNVKKDKHFGFAKRFRITTARLKKEDNENRAGIFFKLTPNSKSEEEKIKGTYGLIEFMPVDQMIKVAGKEYILVLRHQRTTLPFSIKLIDFMKDNYAATRMAKSYKSEVVLIDKNLEQRNLIEMNDPLRYRGYTFYQASFMEGNSDTTILAVVKNVGRLFPYISSIIMCLGLLIHLILASPKLFKRESDHV